VRNSRKKEMFRCPGQDQRFWKPEDIFEVRCPDCGQSVEFFKDEPKLKCRKCGRMVVNPKIDLGCAEWCQYAEQCLDVAAIKNASFIKNKLIDEMKTVFGADQKRIDHALAVLDFAEKIQSNEGGDPFIVKAAAILHDIGIQQAEEKHGSSAGKYQEIEGPIIARAILSKYGLDKEVLEHIIKIIANHHSAKDIDTLEFRCIWDADWLMNFPDEFGNKEINERENLINKIFRTAKGRQMAIDLFMN
jgi:putative nucleotidyltransferase with HDIG domain